MNLQMSSQSGGQQVQGQQMPGKKSGHAVDPMMHPGVDALAQEIRNVSRRLRTQEERYSNLMTKTQITEQNIISRNRRVTAEIKTIESDLNELRKEIMEIKDRIILLVKEIQSSAKKEEVDVLKKYIALWEPLNFITRNELNQILDEELVRRGISKKE